MMLHALSVLGSPASGRAGLIALLAMSASCVPGGSLSRFPENPDAGDQSTRLDASSGQDASGACTTCAGGSDCQGGEACAQFGGDSFCVPSCANGACGGQGDLCVLLSTAEGAQVDVCVPTLPVCGDPNQQPGSGHDAGGHTPDAESPSADAQSVVDSGSTGNCGSLIPPSSPGSCNSCANGAHTCSANGCYGGWWCNSDTSRCQAPPTSCSPGQDAGTNPADASTSFPDATVGPPGAIGPQGGSIDQLVFAIVGDTRPPGINDTSGYPTAVITKIWQDINAENPKPAFAVTTGDYMFASASGSQAAPQLAMYLQARSNFSNITFPTMGNHECTGAVTSNCTGSGQSNNFDAYMQHMIQPLGRSTPYYSVNINSTNGSWTAKFVFVAANAWDTAQQDWLQNTMSQQTTYTFVIRHERSSVSSPGTSPSNQIIAQFPYTLLMVGHTHTYETVSNRQVVIGNGGAPLTGGVNYGYVIAQQRSDGAIVFQEKDYSSGTVNDTFVMRPDGTQTQ
jgi:hypothetical protein